MKDWMKQPFCDATRAWTKLQHAHEELDLITVEAHQLEASIENEEAELTATINEMKTSNAELAQYIVIAFHHRTNVHVHLCTKLAKLKKHLPYNSTFEA